mgnify:CR=1 FL=1
MAPRRAGPASPGVRSSCPGAAAALAGAGGVRPRGGGRVSPRPLPSATEARVAPFAPEASGPLPPVARAPASPLELVPAWKQAPSGGASGPRYVFRREGFGALIYDRETCQYLPFDAEATEFLLARADRPRTTQSPAQSSFLATLQREGILDPSGRLAARLVPDRSHPDQLSAPLTVYLGATEGCNLACSHCQADSAPGALRPVERELMEALFREQHELGAMQVHVTGSRPTRPSSPSAWLRPSPSGPSAASRSA